MTKKLLIVILFFLCFELIAQTRFEYQHQQMGTQIRLVFYATGQTRADVVSKAVFARIDDLNVKLSDYLVDSELNMLCVQAKENVLVSSDLYGVLKASVMISEQTDGVFDVTAGPLIQLWRKARKTKKLPSKSEINRVKQRISYRYISFLGEDTVRLEKQGLQLDLGGIGKGFAADEALRVMEQNGITSALIDMGGDIRVSDPPPNKEYWTLAFSYYDADGKEINQKIKLKNQAVATSGDLYQFVAIDGNRYSHIVDPKTGMALTNGIQVTVIAPNATLADAYASAFSVLGIENSKHKLKIILGLEAFLVEHTKANYQQWNSGDFEQFLIKN